ncbi:cytochrome P450 CYP12A2-like [Culicoides brevitarsis]|uniref:cytochrome P450 CYP12A2-like n=1 Tax=Culicoides brevitarsis TaxID=469753 RepID=UPI00307BE1D2
MRILNKNLPFLRYFNKNERFFSTNVEPRPFHEIPGPKFLHRAFLPGGECYKKDASTTLNYFRRCYGDIYKIYQFSAGSYLVVTFNPNDFAKIYREEGIWPERKMFASVDYFRLEVEPSLAGLLNYQGKQWHEIRTILNGIMMQPKVVDLYVPKVDALTRELVRITKTIRDEKNETSPEFEKYINRWVVDMMGQMAFNLEIGALKKTDPRADKFLNAVEKATELIYEMDILPSIWRWYKTKKFYECIEAQKEVASIAMEYLEESKQKIKNSPQKPESEKGLLEKVLDINESLAKSVAVDTLAAGVDTVTAASKAVLYLLAKNKSKQDKLREEILTILPNKDSLLTSSSLKNLPYLRAVIKESLRIYPPTPGNARQLQTDTILQGYLVPKGTSIAFPNTALSRSEEQFHRATEFLPERWLRNDSHIAEGCKHAKESHPFVYMPFGFGSRSCVGRRFAEMELMVFVIRMLREFHVEWHHADLQPRTTLVDSLVGEARFRLIETQA